MYCPCGRMAYHMVLRSVLPLKPQPQVGGLVHRPNPLQFESNLMTILCLYGVHSRYSLAYSWHKPWLAIPLLPPSSQRPNAWSKRMMNKSSGPSLCGRIIAPAPEAQHWGQLQQLETNELRLPCLQAALRSTPRF